MAIIDIHTHAFPDDLAKRAIEKLSAAGDWQAYGDGTVDGLLRSMDDADIDISVICAIATKAGQTKGIFDWCRKIESDRIHPLPSVHPQESKAAEWVDRFAGEGFHGIKLHPMYQAFEADDSRMDPIYATASLHGMCVVIHSGRDIAFSPDDDRASPRRMSNVLARFPELKLVCTHLGGWEAWDEVAEHLVGKNLLLETSFSLARLDKTRAAAMIEKHGADKVLFGSDWPWNPQKREIELLGSLPLSDKQKQMLLWSNGAKLLGY